MKKVLGAAAVLTLAGVAAAEPMADAVAAGMTLDVSAALLAAVQQGEKGAQPTDGAGTTEGGKEDEKSQFGEAVNKKIRTWFLTTGVGVAGDGDAGTHADLFVAWSTFLGKELEIQLEGSGWYFDQETDNTAGGGFAVNLRWHFTHGAYGGGEGYDWTVYADAGIGLILSGDDVPDDGSSLNLAPRVGLGFTARIDETGKRLVGGVRWHHMSNARFNGDSDNPDFNAPMFYVGMEWPL